MRNFVRHLTFLVLLTSFTMVATFLSVGVPIEDSGIKTFLSRWAPLSLSVFAFLGAVRLRATLVKETAKFFSILDPTVKHLNSAVLSLTDQSQSTEQKTRDVIQSVHATGEAVSEILSQIKVTELNTKTASEKCNSSLKLSISGTIAAQDLYNLMEKVRSRADHIERFSEVLNDIALQTNILSLNAAVEAAHAGNHAGGFNVIATSIRELSVKSAEASREIQKLVSATNLEIRDAHRKTETTRDAFQNIRASTDEVSLSLSQITVACEEQVLGTDQIGNAIQKIENETLTLETGSKTIAKASHDLSAAADRILVASKDLKAVLTSYEHPDPREGLIRLKDQLGDLGQTDFFARNSLTHIQQNAYDSVHKHVSDILDLIKIETGGVATVFAYDSNTSELTRVATNILNNEGVRAVGTSLASGPVKDALLGAQSFSGRLEIFGREYDCAYLPILDNEGLLGALYFGYLIA